MKKMAKHLAIGAAMALAVTGFAAAMWAAPMEAHAEDVAGAVSAEVRISLGELVSQEDGLDTYAVATWEEDGESVSPAPDVTVSIPSAESAPA